MNRRSARVAVTPIIPSGESTEDILEGLVRDWLCTQPPDCSVRPPCSGERPNARILHLVTSSWSISGRQRARDHLTRQGDEVDSPSPAVGAERFVIAVLAAPPASPVELAQGPVGQLADHRLSSNGRGGRRGGPWAEV